MIVYAFRKGVRPGSFSKSLNRSRPKTFAKVRRRALEHIALEGEPYEKCMIAAPARPRAQIRTQPARVHEATTEKRSSDRKCTYETRRAPPRGRAEGMKEGSRSLRHNFVVELKDLIIVPNIADRLRPPVKSDKIMGPHKESWCEFHEAFGHYINNCLALGYQLDELVKNGFLKDYLAGSTATTAPATPEESQAHKVSTHGEVHTISDGFFGGGPAASQRKKYVRSVSTIVEEFPDDPWESDLVFTRADLRDVVPHDINPVVISVVTTGRHFSSHEHKLRHLKSCKSLAKAGNRKVVREVSRTYVFFQGLSIVFQVYQGINVKASSTRKDPASLLIPRRQLLKRFGLQGSGLPHPIQGKVV